MELKGKYALVTGAGSGIGRAAAIKLAAAGADMALLGRTPEELTETTEIVENMGRKTVRVVADVSSDAQMRKAFERAGSEFGQLDFVFANAGINGVWAPIEELTLEEWNKTHAINLAGTFLTLHYAIPLMKAAGGSIAITSSINGTRTFTTAGASAYAASKAGQLAFGQMAALELARHKIRVNIICPGSTVTDIGMSTLMRNREAAKVAAEYPDGTIPLTGNVPAPADEIGELVLFLASERSRHITGTPIWIDGGQSLLI